MRINTRVRTVLESILFPFIPGVINIIIYNDPGFSHLFFLPYGAVAIIISAYYGKLFGFIAIGSSLIWIAGLLPLFLNLFQNISLSGMYWERLWASSWIALPFLILGIYIFGLIRDAHRGQESSLRARMKELVRTNWLLRKTNSA